MKRRKLQRVAVLDEVNSDGEILIMHEDRVLRLTGAVATTWLLLAEPCSRRTLNSAFKRFGQDDGDVVSESLRQLTNEGLVL